MVNSMDNISEIARIISDVLSVNMKSLEDTILSETIKNLSESSAEIGNILSIINDIVD